MEYPVTRHEMWVATDRREKIARKSKKILPDAARSELVRMVIPYIDRVFAEALFRQFLARKGYSARIIRQPSRDVKSVAARFEVARYLRSQRVTMPIIAEIMNRDYDTVRYYLNERHRVARHNRYLKNKAAQAAAQA